MRNELLTGSERGGRRRFDLVIGADGLHSAVRRLAFGEELCFEHPLGSNAATFLAEGYPHRDEGISIGHFLPGRQVWRFSLRENRTAFSFIFTASTRLAEISRDQEEHMAVLRRAFAGTGWESDAAPENRRGAGTVD